MLVTQSCLTLCKSTDCTTPGSSVHEIFQARILEWVAIPFSRESSRPKVQTWDSRTAGRFFTIWATREALLESNIVIFSSVSEGNSYSFFSFLFFKSRTNHELLCQVLRAFHPRTGNSHQSFCPLSHWKLAQMIICLQCGRPGFDPWDGKIPWGRKQQPTPVFLPGESHGERSLAGYSPQALKQLDTTEQLTLLLSNE